MTTAKLEIAGAIARFETEQYVIEVVGEQHNIVVNVPDEGGYIKVKAGHIVPHLMSIIAELG